ncbi:ArnT family glycosyltransferase [Pseudodesulfovibrio sp.]|uniref:ArnT family glycosyltransferase n=1 Tax=unclassified Pseudodesulfovibrio TaxID=2661612 RepID=UPI003B00B58E
MAVTKLQVGNKSDVIHILLGVFLASILIRFVTAEYLDIGGDNAAKWLYAKYLAAGIPFDYWYQQTIRWPILFPLAGIIKLFGNNPALTYVLPILFSSISTAGICYIGIRLSGIRLGMTSALMMLLFPLMVETGSQLWPGIFEMTYIIVCVICILAWLDTKSKRFLALAALAFFLGWGSRVTIIYAYPGLILLLWLPTRRFKGPVLFTLLVGLLCAVEWAAFWAIAGNPMGRIGIIEASHLVTAGLKISWHDYLFNIKHLVKYKGLMAVWFLCMGAAVINTRSEDMRWRGLAWIYIFYALLLFYMISSLSPLKLALPTGPRFWGVIAPMGLLLLANALLSLAEHHPRTGKTILALVVIAFVGFTVKKIPSRNSILQTAKDYTLLRPVLADHKPVLMEYDHWQPNFIEEYVISMFTGKKGKRIPRKDHVEMAMIRNKGRVAFLFVDDPLLAKEFTSEGTLVPEGYTLYRFTPPGSDPNERPTVLIKFGRKLHRAISLTDERAAANTPAE